MQHLNHLLALGFDLFLLFLDARDDYGVLDEPEDEVAHHVAGRAAHYVPDVVGRHDQVEDEKVETLGEKVHQGDDDALADREADLALHLLDLLLVLVQVHDERDQAVGRDALPHDQVPLDELKHLHYNTQEQNTDYTATIDGQ